MSARLSVMAVTSEAVPFAKTGGLADVTGELPKALRDLGHRVTLVLPAYQSVDEQPLGRTADLTAEFVSWLLEYAALLG